jgi:predicted O-methyltransferase YrrM
MNLKAFEIPEEYIKACTSKAAVYLDALERETNLKIAKPNMLTGFAQGRLLSLFSKMMKPNRIIEIGTFTGYGSLCLAEGLEENGVLVTIEKSEENAWLARKYFSISPYAANIKLIIGQAISIIPQLSEQWDLAYIDADKINNLNYFNLIWPEVRPGGMVLIDNIFAHGAVLKPEIEQKAFERATDEMNLQLPELIKNGKVTIIPIRDGLTAIRKE